MSPVPTSRPVPSAPVRLVVPISAVFVLALAAGGCSDDGESSAPSTTAPTTTSPFEVVITEDQIAVGLRKAYSIAGGEPRDLTPQTSNSASSVAPIHSRGADVVPPGTFPDPDNEQIVAEIVIACVPIERYASVIADQLAQQPRSKVSTVHASTVSRVIDRTRPMSWRPCCAATRTPSPRSPARPRNCT